MATNILRSIVREMEDGRWITVNPTVHNAKPLVVDSGVDHVVLNDPHGGTNNKQELNKMRMEGNLMGMDNDVSVVPYTEESGLHKIYVENANSEIDYTDSTSSGLESNKTDEDILQMVEDKINKLVKEEHKDPKVK